MQLGVAKIGDVADRVAAIEKVLTYNHIDISKGNEWPAPSPSTPFSPLSPYAPSPGVGLDRRVLASAIP
jgi:hypothetical protein